MCPPRRFGGTLFPAPRRSTVVAFGFVRNTACRTSTSTRHTSGGVVSTVIVTGGAGFIGSNLADALIADGHTVHVVDDLSHGTREKVPADAVFHQVDIRDQAAMAALTRDADPDVVFHLAAQADVRRAIEDPAFDAAVNVAGTLNVLEAARAVGAKVVFASTGGAGYGEYEGLDVPTPESAQTRPLSHYGMSKMAAEGYCGLYERLYGMHTVVLRLGN
ncbi:MAG: NAD-dependent epimerase/dehydratase family protein, partial [Thermoleophilia bacterium]|nr:NAD-dependent epimerase/dehydratase family protein [Thermoleophilia bacterium]